MRDSSYFPDVSARTAREIVPGAITRTFWADRMMISMVELEPGAVVPRHSHIHEQIGMVVAGALTLTVAEETKTLTNQEIYLIPGDVEHDAVAGPEGCTVFEVFSPVREEYK